MNNLDWQLAINEQPTNKELKLVYSDWLEEQGNIELAHGWREIAKNDYIPDKSIDFRDLKLVLWRKETKFGFYNPSKLSYEIILKLNKG